MNEKREVSNSNTGADKGDPTPSPDVYPSDGSIDETMISSLEKVRREIGEDAFKQRGLDTQLRDLKVEAQSWVEMETPPDFVTNLLNLIIPAPNKVEKA